MTNYTDPKKQAGEAKTPMYLLPTKALRDTAEVLNLGRNKYGIYNWRQSEGVEALTYVGAIMRHLCQYMDGEDADEESGCSHLAHIMAGCSILIDAERVGSLIDNRHKCEAAKEEAAEVVESCLTCKYIKKPSHEDPCNTCSNGRGPSERGGTNWEAKDE